VYYREREISLSGAKSFSRFEIFLELQAGEAEFAFCFCLLIGGGFEGSEGTAMLRFCDAGLEEIWCGICVGTVAVRYRSVLDSLGAPVEAVEGEG
jgi:hypothetical protein